MLNIVTESPGKAWILRRMAEELRALPGVTIDSPSGANAQYFINYALYRKSLDGKKIALFTHLDTHPELKKRFFEVACAVDHCVSMCQKTADILKATQGIDSTIIHPGSDCKRDPIVFGVAGRTYKSGRKGEHLVSAMVAHGFVVRALGEGWPVPRQPAITRKHFYQQIDYLVVTSNNEGGPIPVIDSIAMGVPVIAPDVGLCWEYPVIRYEVNDWNSLFGILLKLAIPRTWQSWRRGHLELFKRLGFLE